MHKYWGKKPSSTLNNLLEKYSNPQDIVLDPFSGYGVFICEALIYNRNVVSNDLNPISNFIQKQLLEKDFDLTKLKKLAKKIIEELEKSINYLYEIRCPNCNNEKALSVSTLRNKNDIPLKSKTKCHCSKTVVEHELTLEEKNKIIEMEKNIDIPIHPNSKIFHNSRISAQKGLETDDLFTTRGLVVNTLLFNLINKIETKYKDLILLAFTSNLANTSRLVPPIKSRGEMSAGAWMTGFYIGETYIENNVIHYFKNRISKLISGKKDYLEILNANHKTLNIKKINNLTQIDNNVSFYIIDNYDAKNLPYPDNSIDYVFTDPPYGDSVPYFEQSVIWNTWLKNNVDYDNEVVISNSSERNKNNKEFFIDIEKCISEIYRILKPNKYFSLTFHSISGDEWYSILNACLKNNFLLENIEWITQKTFTPRQLNRTKTVKGDMLMTFKKSISINNYRFLDKEETINLLIDTSKKLIENNIQVNTNDIYMAFIENLFKNHYIIENINIIDILNKKFSINENGLWNI
ncbi:MAG: hypothetical protein RBR93_11370 [Aliarcobacter butzleri]|nr:hypothetical protein [Aliarcobacter butzleri]